MVGESAAASATRRACTSASGWRDGVGTKLLAGAGTDSGKPPGFSERSGSDLVAPSRGASSPRRGGGRSGWAARAGRRQQVWQDQGRQQASSRPAAGLHGRRFIDIVLGRLVGWAGRAGRLEALCICKAAGGIPGSCHPKMPNV